MQQSPEWHRVSIFNDGLVGVAERFLRKGSKVYLEGQLETRKYQGTDGTDKYTTEVVLRPFRGELALLDRAGADGGVAPAGNGGSAPAGGGHDLADEIPF